MTATIHIAAALAFDAEGRLLLVRKRGATAFMQPGGKLEPNETAAAALARELREELGLRIAPAMLTPLGHFSAPAANEPDHIVEADIFELKVTATIEAAAEIEEAVWVDAAMAEKLDLAALTREHLLPLFRARQGACG